MAKHIRLALATGNKVQLPITDLRLYEDGGAFFVLLPGFDSGAARTPPAQVEAVWHDGEYRDPSWEVIDAVRNGVELPEGLRLGVQQARRILTRLVDQATRSLEAGRDDPTDGTT